MAQQAALSKFKQFFVDDTDTLFEPVDSPSTDPQFTLSPIAPSGLPTTGFALMLKAPPGSEGAATGPFSVTPWLRDPVTGMWASGATQTGVGYSQLWVTFDVDASEIYFFITAAAPGEMLILVSEE